jgi:BirA family biotin operon repressor/biotin-[acetyl-CoA-carboxylase] ligase
MSTSVKPADIWNLSTKRLGRRTIVFDRLESTNTYAATLASDPANDGLVVVAREQTAGRGQHGRTWHAPAGSSVLLSVLLFPPLALRRPALLTAWAAVSVCESIRKLAGLEAQIKWPNDVLIDGRKVCGILIEQRTVDSGQWAVGTEAAEPIFPPTAHWPLSTVCGIGLNLNQTADHFAVAGLEQAGSLACLTGSIYSCDAAARQLICRLDEEYDRFLQGDMQTLEASWKRRLGLLGTPVVAECADGEWHGQLIDVGWDGVQLETSSGSVRLLPEMVRHLWPE